MNYKNHKAQLLREISIFYEEILNVATAVLAGEACIYQKKGFPFAKRKVYNRKYTYSTIEMMKSVLSPYRAGKGESWTNEGYSS
jgi:hypothetical protein